MFCNLAFLFCNGWAASQFVGQRLRSTDPPIKSPSEQQTSILMSFSKKTFFPQTVCCGVLSSKKKAGRDMLWPRSGACPPCVCLGSALAAPPNLVRPVCASCVYRVCVCVCVCVNRCSKEAFRFLTVITNRQGPGVCFRCLQPTKTHLLHSDMTRGRLCHVPAMC